MENFRFEHMSLLTIWYCWAAIVAKSVNNDVACDILVFTYLWLIWYADESNTMNKRDESICRYVDKHVNLELNTQYMHRSWSRDGP